MSFIEHLRQASRTVESWPKWKREVLGKVEPEIDSDNDYCGWMIVRIGNDGTALLENKIGARRRVELADIDKVVQERCKVELELKDQKYAELAAAVWCQLPDEFIKDPVSHQETIKEAERGAKACLIEDSAWAVLLRLSSAISAIQQACDLLKGNGFDAQKEDN